MSDPWDRGWLVACCGKGPLFFFLLLIVDCRLIRCQHLRDLSAAGHVTPRRAVQLGSLRVDRFLDRIDLSIKTFPSLRSHVCNALSLPPRALGRKVIGNASSKVGRGGGWEYYIIEIAREDHLRAQRPFTDHLQAKLVD